MRAGSRPGAAAGARCGSWPGMPSRPTRIALGTGIPLDLAIGDGGVEGVAGSAGPARDLSIALQSDGSTYLSIPVGANNFTPWVDNDWTVIEWTVRGTSGTGLGGGPGSVISGGAIVSEWRPGVQTDLGISYMFLTTAPGANNVSVGIGAPGRVTDHDATARIFAARSLTASLGGRTTRSHVAPTALTPDHDFIHRGKAYGYYITAAGALWWRREVYTRVLTDAEVTAICITHPDMHPIDAAAAEGEDVSDALAHIYQAADRYDSGGGTMQIADQYGTGDPATLIAGTSARFISSDWPY